MEYIHLFSGSRWEILTALSKRPSSTTQLAKQLGTSAAHVSQQLRQLELAGLVSKKRGGTGGSHYAYSIASSAVHAVVLGPRTALKYNPKMNAHARFHVSLSLSKHGEALLGFLLGHVELYKQLQFIGVLDRDVPELFVVADNVDHIRKSYANKEVHTLDGNRRVIVWSHTVDEVKEGLGRKEDYYLKLLADTHAMYDPNDMYLTFTDIVEDGR